MNAFDELLDEVLTEDGNQPLPPGMKERVLASLPRKTVHREFVWAGLAAAVLLGAVGISVWTAAHRIVHTNAVAYPSGVAVVRNDNGKLARSGAVQLSTATPGHPPPTSLRRASLIRLASQQRPIQIPPVVIDSLVIQPIKIASIAHSGSTKGTCR